MHYPLSTQFQGAVVDKIAEHCQEHDRHILKGINKVASKLEGQPLSYTTMSAYAPLTPVKSGSPAQPLTEPLHLPSLSNSDLRLHSWQAFGNAVRQCQNSLNRLSRMFQSS